MAPAAAKERLRAGRGAAFRDSPIARGMARQRPMEPGPSNRPHLIARTCGSRPRAAEPGPGQLLVWSSTLAPATFFLMDSMASRAEVLAL